MQNFLTWLNQNGQNTDSVQVFDFDTTGRGMQAKKQFNPNSVVLAIPLNLIITSKVCLQNEYFLKIGSELEKTNESITIQDVLIIWLILEKRNLQSKWKPYLDVLPSSYTLPVQWPSKTIQNLPDFCISQITDEKRKIDKIIDKINTVLKTLEMTVPSERDYYWAYSTGNYIYSTFTKNITQ